MKIAHVVRRLSFEDWGGTEQVVWNLAKAQAAAGHDVRIFATTALCRAVSGSAQNPGASAQVSHGGAQEQVLQGGASAPPIFRFRPVYPWWPMPRRLVEELDRKGGNPFVPGLGRALRQWRPDVIHCHAMARIAELCIRTAEKTGAAGVVSLHGGGALVPGEEAKSLRAPTRGRIPWGKALDIALRHVRRVPEDFGGIVCVGEDEADWWRSRHPRVLYLPNGVDTALFRERGALAAPLPRERGALEASLPRERGALAAPLQPLEAAPGSAMEYQAEAGSGAARAPAARVLCVARIDRQKGQLALVEALARNPGISLRLVGPVTQADYLAEIEARAAALGVAGRLSIAGPVPPGSAALVWEYRSADAFALASRHEPFGIAVLEAWAAGLPVAAAHVGGLARLCDAHPGAAATFDPADPASLDAALALALAPGPRRERAVAAGLAAAAKYDWRALAAELLEFYRMVRRQSAAAFSRNREENGKRKGATS